MDNQNTLQKSKAANYKTLAVLTLILWIAGCSDKLFSQNVTKDVNGNFHQVVKKQSPDSTGTKTSYTFEDSKGEIYPVYLTTSGKYFVWRISKNTGNKYRKYLNTEATKKD